MRFDRLLPVLLALSALVLLTACGQEPPEEPLAPEPTLTVWHAWDEAAVPALESAVGQYEEGAEVAVDLVAFEDESALIDELNATDSPPDVFFGSHVRVDDLRDRGIVDAYCRPPQCEECRGTDPADWCPYALGRFGGTLIDRFQIDAGYCASDMCPVCYGDNPPFWCRYASDVDRLDEIEGIDGVDRPEGPIDLPRALYSIGIDGDAFPLGIPIWWEYWAVTANRSWFEERELEIPRNVDSLRTFLDEHGDAVRVDDTTFNGHPVPFPADLGPLAREAGDPNPQPNRMSEAALLFGSSVRLPEYREALADPQVLALEGYRPAVLVHGAFLRQGTEMRNEGLNFMYDLTYPSFQQQLFEETGALPANDGALSEVEQSLPEGAVEVGVTSIPLGAGKAEQQ